MEYIVSVIRKILWTKIQALENLNKIVQCFYQIVLLVATKKWLALDIRSSIKQYLTILIIVEMISLKLIKQLKNCL